MHAAAVLHYLRAQLNALLAVVYGVRQLTAADPNASWRSAFGLILLFPEMVLLASQRRRPPPPVQPRKPDRAEPEMDDMEDAFLKWFREEDAEDAAVDKEVRASYVRLCRLRRETLAIKKRMAEGGRKRKNPQRSNAEHDKRIMDDFYGTPAVTIDGVIHECIPPWQSLHAFYRRFRMGPKLFAKLLKEIQHPEDGHKMFRVKPNCAGDEGPTALQRLTAVIRILAYGIAFDAVHDYTGVQELLARNCTYAFCDWIAAKYGSIHLGVWTPEAIQKEMDINAKRGFDGMLGSLDCTHWIWKNCPYPWQGQFYDRLGHKSVIAEAIAGSDLYFWHVFVGVPGSHNDQHVLGVSSLSNKYMKSTAATKVFYIDGEKFTGCYFLADGIYPDYAYLMKTFSKPADFAEKLFAKVQEGARKDVERAFGRLMSKWCITAVASRTWFVENLNSMWTACFILHNMTIRDNDDTGFNEETETLKAEEQAREQERMAKEGRGGAREPLFNPEEELDELDEIIGEDGVHLPPMGVPVDQWESVLQRLGHMQCHFQNYKLKNRTKDFLWNKYGKCSPPPATTADTDVPSDNIPL